jgi:hypothetical protein
MQKLRNQSIILGILKNCITVIKADALTICLMVLNATCRSLCFHGFYILRGLFDKTPDEDVAQVLQAH